MRESKIGKVIARLFAIAIVICIGVLFYTEKTGKTNLQAVFSQYVLGIDPSESEGEEQYTLAKKDEPRKWDPGEQAMKDADSYHKEAKEFANKTSNTVNAINDAAK